MKKAIAIITACLLLTSCAAKPVKKAPDYSGRTTAATRAAGSEDDTSSGVDYSAHSAALYQVHTSPETSNMAISVGAKQTESYSPDNNVVFLTFTIENISSKDIPDVDIKMDNASGCTVFDQVESQYVKGSDEWDFSKLPSCYVYSIPLAISTTQTGDFDVGFSLYSQGSPLNDKDGNPVKENVHIQKLDSNGSTGDLMLHLSESTSFDVDGNMQVTLNMSNGSMDKDLNGFVIKIGKQYLQGYSAGSANDGTALAQDDNNYIWTFNQTLTANSDLTINIPFKSVAKNTPIAGNKDLPIDIYRADGTQKIATIN